MRILFICENYYPHKGGAETLFKKLAEGFVEQGHEVDVITQKHRNTVKEEVINGVKIHRIFTFYSRYLFTFFSIPKALAGKADIIQTTTFNGAPAAWLVSRILRKKAVLTIHETWINKWKLVTDFSKTKRFVHEMLERIVYTLNYDCYVCVSKATAWDVKKIKPQGNIKVIYNGVDYEYWNPRNFNGKNLKQHYNGKFIGLCWGRPGVSKGFEYAIKAASLIPNFVLVFVTSSIETYKKRFDYLMSLREDNVVVKQDVPDVRNYVASADCVIIPSIAEGFGYTAAEACAMRKVVVASNAGSLPEIVSGKFILVPPKDEKAIAEAVKSVMKGKYKITELKKFLWKDTISQYLAVYKEMVSN